jgi:hypothetical protein
MNKTKIYFCLAGLMTLLSSNAFATSSSQILVMSQSLYKIGQDMTSGIWPTAILMIAIGIWACVQVFGKNMGDGIHHLTNIIAVGAVLFFGTSMLTNAGFFSCSF